MALSKCKECGGQVSAKAEACPQCGAKQPKRTGLGTWIVGGVFGLLVFSCTISMNNSTSISKQATSPPTPEQTAAKQREEREFQTVLAGAMHLKSAMKKPEAFKLDSARMIDGKVICYEYTSRNSFNDQRREVYVVTDTVSSGDVMHWNKHCAGKSGTDYTYARAVLP